MSKISSLPRGGLPPPSLAWYQNLSNSNTTPQPFSTYRDPQLYLGFNITPNQFAVIEDRIMELLQVNDLFNATPSAYSTTIAHWGILEVLGNEFPCLFKDDVPGWWAFDALRGWIKKAASWMKAHEGEVKGRRLFNKSHWEGPRQKKTKLANMVLLKHCHFMVTVRGEAGKVAIVPLVDLLVGGKRVDDGVGDLQAGNLQVMLLFGALARDVGFGALDTLVYTISSAHREKIDIVVMNDADLRNAAMCLRSPGRSVMYLEVIRAVMEFSQKENLNQYQSSPSSDTYNPTPEDDILQRTEPDFPQPRLLNHSAIKEPGLQAQVLLDALPQRTPSFNENIYDAESDEEVFDLVGPDNDATNSNKQCTFTEPTIKEEPDVQMPTPLLYDPERSFHDDERSSLDDTIDIETSGLGSFDIQSPQRMFSHEAPGIQGESSPLRVSALEYDPERSINTNHSLDMGDNLDDQASGSAAQFHNQRITPDVPIKDELSTQRMINVDYDAEMSFNTNKNHDLGDGIDEEINGSTIQYADQCMTPAIPTIKEEQSPLRQVNIKHELATSSQNDVATYGAESVDDEIAGLVGPVVKRPKLRLKVRKRIKEERSSAPRSPEVIPISPGEFHRKAKHPAESVDDEIAGLVAPIVNCPPSPRSSRLRKRHSSRR